jgi:hypothetical protein
MDGIKVGDVTLFLMEIPYRKSLAFAFKDGVNLIPVAYVGKKYQAEATILWNKLIQNIPNAE